MDKTRAAGLLGLSVRHVRRMLAGYREQGAAALADSEMAWFDSCAIRLRGFA